MTFAIYTTDLSRANAHLMPWRTILEVAKGFQKQGVDTVVISGGAGPSETILDGVRVVSVRRPRLRVDRATFEQVLAAEGAGTLYFPVAPGPVNGWIRGLPLMKNVRVVWYMPGSWYSLRQVFVAARHLRFRAVLPYAIQAFWPKRRWVRGLLADGATPLITMTEFTADRMVEAGYPRAWITAIPPGKDRRSCATESLERFTRLAPMLAGSPFFLFFGPPNPIRGVVQMIAAFKRFAAESGEGKLVCLFRADGNVDPLPIRRLIERAGLHERLIAVWESVNGCELDAFLENCRAVLKPFLVVPSEIPLAVIETARHGKPVVGFGPDGTGAFIDRFGLTVRHGDVGGLASAMRRIVTDEKLYAEKSRAARVVYERCPAWGQVSEQWRCVGGKPERDSKV